MKRGTVFELEIVCGENRNFSLSVVYISVSWIIRWTRGALSLQAEFQQSDMSYVAGISLIALDLLCFGLSG